LVERVPITVIEVEPFPAKAAQVWNDEERLEFIGFIASNPEAGDLILAPSKKRPRRSALGVELTFGTTHD